MRGAARSRGEFRNWAGNQVCLPKWRHEPRSEEELAAVLRGIRDRGERARIVGSGHSWSDAALTDQHLISLQHHAGIVQVDREALTVTAGGGTRLRDLVEALEAHGLALPNLGSISEQTLAGAIATGTHGTGIRHGSLASGVTRLRLVLADGSEREVGPGEPDLLDAARVSLGCLGAVTEVTLRVVEAFDLAVRSWSVPFDEALRTVQELVEAHAHVKLWWLPHTERVQVFAANATTAPRTTRSRTAIAADTALNRYVFSALLAACGRMPASIPRVNRIIAASYFRPARRVDRSDRIFNLAMPPRHLEVEYGIRRDDAGEALRRVAEVIEQRRFRVNFIVELRFVAAESAWLSGSFGRDSCQLGAYMAPTRECADYFRAVEEIALELGGRPHWGKLFECDADQLRRVHPMLGRFDEVRRRLDPTGVFVNPFVERVLGLRHRAIEPRVEPGGVSRRAERAGRA